MEKGEYSNSHGQIYLFLYDLFHIEYNGSFILIKGEWLNSTNHKTVLLVYTLLTSYLYYRNQISIV